MALLTFLDVPDQDLTKLSTELDLDNADEFLNDLALENGVRIDELQIDPLPFKVKRMLIFWVMVEICTRNLGRNITTTASGHQTDWYQKKLERYELKLNESIVACTGKVLKGEADEEPDNSRSTTSIERA